MKGDAAVVMMADESDDCRDVVRYWQKLNEGWDCAREVFQSRGLPEKIVSCPHCAQETPTANAYEDPCAWRKPQPGMLFIAIRQHI
jgi:histidinol phosphatase-like enzyme